METQSPARAVLELDGHSWRPLAASDHEALWDLASLDGHRLMHSLPGSQQALVEAFGGRRFRLAMVCTGAWDVDGVAAVTHRSRRNLNLHLACMFRVPAQAAVWLAIYVRHLFWLMPLHRIYAQLPMVDGADAYVHLLEAIGFANEGLVRDHALIEGRSFDVAVLGILRAEFEAWCAEHESRLNL